MKKLKQNFFKRKTLIVAKELLGKYIVRMIKGKKLVGKIVEVEAYNGFHDLASHASRGKTRRNALMFGQAGYSYVYLIYGLNYCFNIVTEKNGYPAAVLIRAVEPMEGVETMVRFRKKGHFVMTGHCPVITKCPVITELTNGPGKFCQAFKIDKKLNGVDLTKSKDLWLEDKPAVISRRQGKGEKIKKAGIAAAKRIGVDYAGQYKDKLWRFYLKGNKWVSKAN